MLRSLRPGGGAVAIQLKHKLFLNRIQQMLLQLYDFSKKSYIVYSKASVYINIFHHTLQCKHFLSQNYLSCTELTSFPLFTTILSNLISPTVFKERERVGLTSQQGVQKLHFQDPLSIDWLNLRIFFISCSKPHNTNLLQGHYFIYFSN